MTEIHYDALIHCTFKSDIFGWGEIEKLTIKSSKPLKTLVIWRESKIKECRNGDHEIYMYKLYEIYTCAYTDSYENANNSFRYPSIPKRELKHKLNYL